MRKALVLWFTGLSGSGKTTIAEKAARRLVRAGSRVKLYDGDSVRKEINAHLGFTPADIKQNNRIIAEMCAEEVRAGRFDYIFVPVISPFEVSRKLAAKIIGDPFRLVYVKASVDEVVRRDPKGLYKKALGGQIENFIGIDSKVPFQAPRKADLVLDTEEEDMGKSVTKLLSFLYEESDT